MNSVVAMAVSYVAVLLVRRFPFALNQTYSHTKLLVRRLIYIISLCLPVLAIREAPDIHLSPTGFVAAGLTFAVAVALNLNGIRQLFDRELAELLGRPEVVPTAIETGTGLIGGACEELFYRWYLITALLPSLGYWVILASTSTFVLHHAVHPRSGVAFRVRDYVTQGVMGAGLALSVIVGGSVLPALVAHVLYNAILLTGRYYRLAVIT